MRRLSRSLQVSNVTLCLRHVLMKDALTSGRHGSRRSDTNITGQCRTRHAGFQGISGLSSEARADVTHSQNTIMLNVLLPPIILNSGFELKQVSIHI